MITIVPRSYREALALAIRRRRPYLEVKVATPDDLDREVESFAPHLVVCNELSPTARENARSWVHVLFHDSLDATVSGDVREARIADIGMDDLFSIITETKELVSGV